jgi:HEPN domain-containing protein
LPNPEAREPALLLIRKAKGDESILERPLDDPEVADDVLGFHVQQAVEKRLKAVLVYNEVEYDRTHSISYLTALLERHGIELPGCRAQIEELTPWAVAARYDDSLEEVLDGRPPANSCRRCASGRNGTCQTRCLESRHELGLCEFGG